MKLAFAFVFLILLVSISLANGKYDGKGHDDKEGDHKGSGDDHKNGNKFSYRGDDDRNTCRNNDDKNQGHDGEQKCLSYSITYVDPPAHEDYPEFGYYGVPAYYLGESMHYSVEVTNTCKRTFKSLRVVGVQRYFNDGLLPYQDWTEAAPYWNGASQTFFINTLKPGESEVFSGSYNILGGVAGLDQTQLLIMHWEAGNPDSVDWSKGRIIVNNEQAGIWCPPV